jgi:hypothetical protein
MKVFRNPRTNSRSVVKQLQCQTNARQIQDVHPQPDGLVKGFEKGCDWSIMHSPKDQYHTENKLNILSWAPQCRVGPLGKDCTCRAPVGKIDTETEFKKTRLTVNYPSADADP